MRDTQKPLRTAIYNVLNGNVTYDGETVFKLYDEKKKVGQTERIYGLFGTQQTTRDRTSEYWITDERIDIEIVHSTEFEVSKDMIDDISDQLYLLLMPGPINSALADPTSMLIQHFELEQALTRAVEISPTQSEVSKIITFFCKIIQQQ